MLLKQIVIYDKPLSSDEILNNYILYRDSISEMLSIYNRNNITNNILREHGITVFEMSSAELSRGRGGPRCMSMPLIREEFK